MSEVSIQVSDLLQASSSKNAKAHQYEEFIEHIRSFYQQQQILNDRFISEFDRRKEELDRAEDGTKQPVDNHDETPAEHGTLLLKE